MDGYGDIFVWVGGDVVGVVVCDFGGVGVLGNLWFCVYWCCVVSVGL